MKLFCPHIGLIWKKQLNLFYKEIFRKAIHLCSSFVPLFLKLNYWATLILLALAGFFYTVTQILSLNGIRVPLVSDVTDIAARDRDRGKFVLGPLTLVLGIILTAVLWKGDAAAVGILALAFGDGLASLGGKILGNIHVPHTGGKTCAGSLVCLIAIFISSSLVLHDTAAALVIAVAGMMIEIFPLKDFDNLLIPVSLGALANYFLSH